MSRERFMSFRKSVPLVAGVIVLGLVLVLSSCSLMRGSDYPSHDITFIIPFAPGGSADPVARAIAQEAEPLLKVKLNPVNKPGASGATGHAEVVQSKPDGYTIGLMAAPQVASVVHTTKLPYFGPEDYQPLVRLTEHQDVLAVRADASWKTFEEFMADAQKRPGAIRVGTPGSINSPELELTELEQLSKVKFTHVPFSSGGAEVITALLGGHTEAGTITSVAFPPLAEAKQVRGLAVFEGEPVPILGTIPSMAKFGYKLSKVGGLYGIFGPKGMDKAVVDKLANAFMQAAKSPTFDKWARDNGYVPRIEGPAEVTAEIKGMLEANGKMIKALGLDQQQK